MPIEIRSRNWLVGLRQAAYAMALTHNPLLDSWLAVFAGNQRQTYPAFEFSAGEWLLNNGNDAGLFCAIGEGSIVGGASDHDSRYCHIPRTKELDQFDPGHFRHVLIDEETSKLIGVGRVQEVRCRLEASGGDSACAQEKAQRIADRRIVFYNSHRERRHVLKTLRIAGTSSAAMRKLRGVAPLCDDMNQTTVVQMCDEAARQLANVSP